MQNDRESVADVLERARARLAAKDASGEMYVDCSIYEGMVASLQRNGRTVAHVVDYADAVEIADAVRLARQRFKPTIPSDLLVTVLEDCRDWLKSAPLQSGMCCCGSPVEGHGMGDGHSPVDDLAYSAMQLQDRITAALARTERTS